MVSHPTSHNQSKVGIASLLLIGIFINPSDLEEENADGHQT
jgi:hypothetical protein